MLTQLFERNYEKTVLKEPEIFGYEERHFTPPDNEIKNDIKITAQLSSGDQFMHLDESYLLVKWKIVLADGDMPDNDTQKLSLTHGAASLFKGVSLDLNGTRLDYNHGPGQTYNILSKCGASIDHINATCHDEFYYPCGYFPVAYDTDAAYLEKDAATTAESDVVWKTGARRTEKSKEVYSKIPLKKILGVCNTGKLFNNVKLELNLQKEIDYNKILLKTTDLVGGPPGAMIADGETRLLSLSWVIPFVKVSPKLALEYAKKSKSPMHIDFQQLYYNNMTAGNEINVSFILGGKRPRFVLVGFQPAAVDTGQVNNSSAFSITNPSNLYLTVNNVQFPAVAYRGVGDGYLSIVEAIKRAFGKKSNESSNMITASNWAQFNAIALFDCSHVDDITEENNQSNVLATLRGTHATGDVRLHILSINDEHMKLNPLATGQVTLVSAK